MVQVPIIKDLFFHRHFASLKGELVPYLVRKQFSKPKKGPRDASMADDDANSGAEPTPGGENKQLHGMIGR